MTAYSTTGDLLVGDMTIGSIDTDQYVNAATDEINGELGRIYVLPLTPTPPPDGHVALTLKNCNNFIASGRLIMAQAVGAESESTHAYGQSLVNEGKRILERIMCGEIELGCTKVPAFTPVAGTGNGPSIHNADAVSGVDAFYRNTRYDPYGVPTPWAPGP